MFVLMMLGGYQGYIAYKDYKKVVDKLTGAKHRARKTGEEATPFLLFTPTVEQVNTQTVTLTPLSAEVEGIVHSDEAWLSFAMIKTGGQQRSYREGDTLSDHDDAWVEAINKDRVVVQYQGVSHALELKPPDYFKGEVQTPPVEKVTASMRLAGLSLSHYFVLKPAMQDGKLQGYNINPRNASDYFKYSGFELGDIVVKVDESDMTQAEQAKAVIANWSKMKAAEVVVRRHAQLKNIQINVLNN
ncbi:type II secretion system protein GspC [Scandinavium sp. TWS1a]|uniref:type II secretion system protein GspC n=1 Tax=Scandinavium tedordense TaxID=2926521 RepID=UPI00135CCFBE|nr:type II secretion system protein GspC [Scandinavium tedordense]MCS2172287.1 type II secretion system protein GspC [Scandinavium tedordense]